jgi:DHA1 family multidrug resistance protein-like MFS transporter
VTLGIMTLAVTVASSIFSTATEEAANDFGVSAEVMILGTSLFVLGFAFGPLIFGPMSELYGRRTPMFLGMFCFAIFQIPVAVAQDIQTIFVCRFFGGTFASAPLAIVRRPFPPLASANHSRTVAC